MEFYESHAVIAQTEAPPSTPSDGGGGAPGGQKQPGMGSFLFPMIMMFVLFYFLLIRPQRKRQKAMEEQINSLRVGDNVITAGGIHGRVTNKNDAKATVTVQVSEGVKIKFLKTSVSTVIPAGNSDEDDAADEAESEKTPG